MKKIISLFARNYDGDRLVRNELVSGSEWVIKGEGIAYRKWDGTSCMIRDGVLFKRYDRKRNKKSGKYKPSPMNWEPCESTPNKHTGHWPGWIPVGDGPEDKWHKGADSALPDGTYELCGPKIQGNPEGLTCHQLIPHTSSLLVDAPRDFDALKRFFMETIIEGIVWHHPDGRMVKIKVRDFGIKRK